MPAVWKRALSLFEIYDVLSQITYSINTTKNNLTVFTENLFFLFSICSTFEFRYLHFLSIWNWNKTYYQKQKYRFHLKNQWRHNLFKKESEATRWKWCSTTSFNWNGYTPARFFPKKWILTKITNLFVRFI